MSLSGKNVSSKHNSQKIHCVSAQCLIDSWVSVVALEKGPRGSRSERHMLVTVDIL